MKPRTLGAAALAAALLATGCATAPASQATATPAGPAAADVDPAGTYSFTTQAGGEVFSGILRITRGTGGTRGPHGGTVSTPVAGDMRVRSVEVQGQRIRVMADGRLGAAVMNIDRNAADFTGSWTYGGSRGMLAGRYARGDVAPEHLPVAGEPGTEYVGNYDLPGAPPQIRIFEQGGVLRAQATGQGAFSLLYTGGHRFQGPPNTGVFLEFAVTEGRATGFTFRRATDTLPATRIP
jgi:hypothetical protein